MREVIIGLEIHLQPSTKSKMFCGCSADVFGAKPNTKVCPVCFGLPGALPVPNKTAIEKTVLLGLAFNCEIAKISKFDRKHYFYPDLPKGYQISQYDQPLCSGGYFTLKNGKSVGITRVHIEEDTGKLTYRGNKTFVDFNRSGMPLIELVTEPDFKGVEDIDEFTKELRSILRHLDISFANMEKGQLRLEANVSIRDAGMTSLPPYKVELKNINSFRFLKKAISFEVERQSRLLDKGDVPTRETRGWNEKKNETFSQREKEEAHDYRYFSEPDIPPFEIKQEYIQELSKRLSNLPSKKREKYLKKYQLREDTVDLFINDKELAEVFESVAREAIKRRIPFGVVAKYLVNKPAIRDKEVSEIIEFIQNSETGAGTDTQLLEKHAREVLAENPLAVKDFKKGKTASLQFLVGRMMKKTKGKIDPKQAMEKLREMM